MYDAIAIEQTFIVISLPVYHYLMGFTLSSTTTLPLNMGTLNINQLIKIFSSAGCESKSKQIFYHAYYSEAGNKFAGPTSASLRMGYTAVASRWQLCVLFDRPGIQTFDLTLQRRTPKSILPVETIAAKRFLFASGSDYRNRLWHPRSRLR